MEMKPILDNHNDTWIYVCSRYKVVDTLYQTGCRYLLSISAVPEIPENIELFSHKIIKFSDIDQPTARNLPLAATREDIMDIIEFGRIWAASSEKKLMVNCQRGHRRSTAAALILLALFNQGKEIDCVTCLRSYAPHAEPNVWMIKIAEEILGTKGKMIEAIKAGQPQTRIHPGVCRLPAFPWGSLNVTEIPGVTFPSRSKIV